jgi:hypothetical protein
MADISKITTPDGTSWDVKDPKARGVELTQAEYDALEQAGEVLPDVDYHITDAQAGAPLATEIAMSTSDNTSVAEIIAPFGFNKLKTQTFTGLTVPANYIDTRDLTLSVPAKLGILSGFALVGTSNCAVVQCYFTNRTTLHTRVLNLATQQDSYSFVVFYI